MATDVKHVGVLIIVINCILLSALAGGPIDCICTVRIIKIIKENQQAVSGMRGSNLWSIAR
jgi:hypothetical protein